MKAEAPGVGVSDPTKRILRGLDGLGYDEFEEVVQSIAEAADRWDDKLAAELA